VDRTDSHRTQPVGLLADDHELSARARRYGERVVSGTEWPIDAVDCAKITWGTSTRAKRRHGRCSYHGDGRATITLTEHTYERAGFEACRTTIRHELVHAWQYQHRGRRAISSPDGVSFLTDSQRPSSTHTTTTTQPVPTAHRRSSVLTKGSPSRRVTAIRSEPGSNRSNSRAAVRATTTAGGRILRTSTAVRTAATGGENTASVKASARPPTAGKARVATATVRTVRCCYICKSTSGIFPTATTATRRSKRSRMQRSRSTACR